MNRAAYVLIAGVAATAACSDGDPVATLPLYDVAPAMGVAANGGNNAAVPLSGGEEVPARETRARGAAVFHLDDAGSTLTYRLIASNITNVVASHIHIGPAGENGPVGVFLFGPAPAGGGRTDGVLAEGSLTPGDFVGPLAGLGMDDLIDHMVTGNAYVNVHTNDGVDPIDTGPGDFPGGEIRGQIR